MIETTEEAPAVETRFLPTFDRILVRPESPPKKARIVRPDNAQHEPQQEGVVIAAGPGHYSHGVWIPMTIKPGMRVYYGSYHGVDVDIDGTVHKILAEGEVLALIERSSLVTV